MLHRIPALHHRVEVRIAVPRFSWGQRFARLARRFWDSACRRAERPDRFVPYY